VPALSDAAVPVLSAADEPALSEAPEAAVSGTAAESHTPRIDGPAGSVARVLPDEASDPRPRQVTIPIEVSALTVILALVLALLAGAGAALYQRSKPTHFISYASMLIDQPFAVAQDSGDATLAKLQRLRFYYAGLVQTSVIAAPVANQLQGDYHLTTGQIEGAVNTLMGADTFTIDLFAQGRNPEEAAAIAQAATAELIDYVKRQQRDLGIPSVQRVTLTEVTSPAAGIKVTVSTKKQLVSAGVAFVVVGAAFIIVADLLRRRW
jgi:capsular polysaccharide biosynthesis protein